MKLGIIGKPQSGKTSLFNAASGQQVAVGDFSGAIHRAIIKVPDERLEKLAEIENPKKITYAEIEFLDSAGFSGEGKSSGALEISADLRQMEAFAVVIDAFSPDATPETDVQNLIDEMIITDQAMIESNIEKRERKIKLTGDTEGERELKLLAKCLTHLEDEKPLVDFEFVDGEEKLVRGYQFLSQKPLLILFNISEDSLDKADEIESKYASMIRPGRQEIAVMCAKIESEIVALDDDEREMFTDELGIKTPAVEKVIKKSYSLLGLISFLTAGEPEVRAWTITKGTIAQKAAGVIHSDIERGFIRAETTSYADYIEYKTAAALKAAGKTRLEGKTYKIADGDVILFRFNV